LALLLILLSGNLPDRTWLAAQIVGQNFFLEACGTADSLAETGEQFAWLGTALRSSASDFGVTYCKPIIISISSEAPLLIPPKAAFTPKLLCKIGFKEQDDTLRSLNGQCWHNLFRNPSVVLGYPIPTRSRAGQGLEVSLEIMAGLAHARRASIFDRKLFLKGFSTMLIPTKVEDDLLVWHLLYKKNGDHISYLETTVLHAEEIGLNDLTTRRHILGWCSAASNYAGKNLPHSLVESFS
jgi:hypothetical protein